MAIDREKEIGKRYGKLVILDFDPEPDKHGKPRINAVCDCGEKKVFHFQNLRRGATKSCGCLKLEPRACERCQKLDKQVKLQIGIDRHKDKVLREISKYSSDPWAQALAKRTLDPLAKR